MIGMQICHNLAVTFDLHLKSQISHCCLYMYKCYMKQRSVLVILNIKQVEPLSIYLNIPIPTSQNIILKGGCHIKSLGDPCFAEIKTIHFIRILANCITYFYLI